MASAESDSRRPDSPVVPKPWQIVQTLHDNSRTYLRHPLLMNSAILEP
jgi:hypothetical protein